MAPTRGPTWADDFAKFIEDSHKVDYADLGAHWRSSEWKYRLRQRGTSVAPDATVLVDTEVLIGRDWLALEVFDTITMRLPPGPGPVTLVTRMQIEQSLIGVVFGRLPPVPAASAVAPGQMNGGEVHVDMAGARGDVPLPGEGGEYVADPAPAVDVVARREPDGLPIFVDLYGLGNPAGDVIDALLDEVAEFVRTAQSVEQLMALATKNPDLLTFVRDFGDERDRVEMKEAIDARRRELTIPAAAQAASNAPRRRVRGAATN